MHKSQQVSLDGRFWLVLAMLSFIWGANFTANEAALTTLGPHSVVIYRAVMATLLIWPVLLAKGHALPKSPRLWLSVGALGLASLYLPNILLSWAQAQMASGLAGILNASVAIFTVIFAAMSFHDERLTPLRALGCLSGFAGLVVTIGTDNLLTFNLHSVGQLAVIAASCLYGVTVILMRKYMRDVPPEIMVAIFMTATAVIGMPIDLVMHGLPRFDLGWQAWLGLAFLAIFGSLAGHLLLYRYLPVYGASNMNLFSLLTGPVAILLGSIFFAESLPPRAYAGFGLIAFGLLLIDGRPFRAANRWCRAFNR